MSDLPHGWAWATVGDVADLADGPFGSNLKTAHYVESGPRVVRLQNIGDGFFRDERAHITRQHFDQLEKHAVRGGDVVVASLGDDAPRACLVPSWLGPALVKADCIRLRPRGAVEARYVMWMLNSPPVRREAANRIKGIGRPRLGLGGIRSLTLPVPPLAEQRRIVEAIEEQLSRLEAAQDALSSLHLRLVAARRSAISHAMRNPEWPRARIGDVGDGSRNALAIGPFGSNLKVSDYRDGGVPLVFVRNIRARQFGGPHTRFVSHQKAKELASHRARAGDVLITKMGDPPGDTTVYPEGQPDAIITADCIKISVRADFDPQFVALAIEGPEAHQQVLGYTQGVAQRKVSLGRFKEVLIPAPPLEEQRRVVAQLDNLVRPLRGLEVTAHLAARRSAALRRAILGRALCGELVAQDPDDEPACILLERIAAERAATTTPARKRRERAPS